MTRPARPARGSASVEFVFLVPFVLVLLAAIWDVRSFIATRTELAREPYVVAEAIADQPEGASPMASALELLVNRLREGGNSSGVVSAAVVVRGNRRHDGSACATGAWCPPRVAVTWPAGPGTEGAWTPAGSTDPNPCAASALPAAGAHFGASARVLANEGVDPDGDGPTPPPGEASWVSRKMEAAEWWVVVDVCFDPGPGQFLMALPRLAANALDIPYTIRRRAAWRSIHDLPDCDWC